MSQTKSDRYCTWGFGSLCVVVYNVCTRRLTLHHLISDAEAEEMDK